MKIVHFSIALLAVISLVGCKSDSPSVENNPVASAPLRINVGVAEMVSPTTSDSKHGTKAGIVTSATFQNEAKINVILVSKITGTTVTEYPVSAQYICSVSEDTPAVTTWTAVNTTPTITLNPAKVLAYYPAVLAPPSTLSADMTQLQPKLTGEMPFGDISDLDFKVIKVPIEAIGNADVWFAKGDEDYMVGAGNDVIALAPGEDGPSKNTSKITMKHALSMVVVQIEPAREDEKFLTVSGLAIENVGANLALQQGDIELETNTFTGNNIGIKYSRPMSGYDIGSYFGLLVYPADIAADQVIITCSVGAAAYTYKVKAIKWDPGMVYLYKLKLNSGGGVLDGKVMVTDWPTTVEHDVVVE